jgi:hypothetical protein
MKVTTMLALGLMLLGTSTVFAATATKKHHAAAAAPTHHCQLNGAEVQKSKKACLKAGGTWEKGAPSTKGSTASAPATEPAK